jgi:hypothetical protein
MAEFEINGITYKNKKLSAMDQLDLMLDLSPLLVSVKDLIGLDKDSSSDVDSGEAKRTLQIKVVSQIATSIADMPREKTHALIAVCMGSCERKMVAGKGWAKVWNEAAHQPMFDDIGLMEIGGIVIAVLQDNFQNFLPGTG